MCRAGHNRVELLARGDLARNDFWRTRPAAVCAPPPPLHALECTLVQYGCNHHYCLPQVVARRRRGGAALDFVLAPPRESLSLAARFDLNRMNLDPWLTVSLPDCHALRREGPSSSCASVAPEARCVVRMPGDARARPQVVASEVLGPWPHCRLPCCSNGWCRALDLSTCVQEDGVLRLSVKRSR